MNSTKHDISQISSEILRIIEDNLKDPRKAVLIISKIKLPNRKRLGIYNAEIAYEKGVIYAIEDYEKYKFNATALIKKCNNLIRRSLIKKKKKKKN